MNVAYYRGRKHAILNQEKGPHSGKNMVTLAKLNKQGEITGKPFKIYSAVQNTEPADQTSQEAQAK